MVVMAAAIYCAMVLFLEGVGGLGGLRWIDTGSEFGLCYLCWIFLFAVFWWGLLYFSSSDFLGRGGIWVSA